MRGFFMLNSSSRVLFKVWFELPFRKSLLLLSLTCCVCVASPRCRSPTPRISTARSHLVEVGDEIGKAEVVEQEDALERTRQAAIHERDVEQQGEEAVLDENNENTAVRGGGGEGGGDAEDGGGGASKESGNGNQGAADAAAAGNEGIGSSADRQQEPNAAPEAEEGEGESSNSSEEEVGKDPEPATSSSPDTTLPKERVADSSERQVMNSWKTGADVRREADGEMAAASSAPRKKKHAGLRAVIVGNGPSVVAKGKKAKPLGAVIDSYDHVYRFNLFKTKGFESHVGTKTTHWILSMIKKAADVDDEEVPAITKHLQAIIIPMAFRECKNPKDQAKGCPGSKPKNAAKKMAETEKEQKGWKDLPPNVKVVAKEIPENAILYGKYDLFEKFPSTGLMILNMAAEQYDEVAFVGFDFESADHQHYWEVKVKNETCHNMNQEAEIINRQIEEGRLTPLVKKPRGGGGGGEEDWSGGYDPNCKILCGADGCAKLTGAAFAEHKRNPKKWEKEHHMSTPRKMGVDAKRKNSKKKDAKDGLAADAASGL